MFSQFGGWKALLSLSLIFVAGVVSGAVGSGIYVRRVMHEMLQAGPREIEQAALKRIAGALNLTPEQEQRMQPIVRQAHQRLMGLRAAHQGEIDRIIGDARQRAEEFLDNDQQVKLERVLNGLRERWQRLSPGPGNDGSNFEHEFGPPEYPAASRSGQAGPGIRPENAPFGPPRGFDPMQAAPRPRPPLHGPNREQGVDSGALPR